MSQQEKDLAAIDAIIEEAIAKPEGEFGEEEFDNMMNKTLALVDLGHPEAQVIMRKLVDSSPLSISVEIVGELISQDIKGEKIVRLYKMSQENVITMFVNLRLHLITFLD